MAQNTPILGKIKSSESAASLDAKYGPYASKAAANAALGENGDDVITAGLTVGVTQYDDGSVKEFWYQPDGQGGLQLVEKQVAAQEETDPTVPAWAKTETKPSYTASEVGAIPDGDKGVAGGVATLGSDGKVPQSQLPSYVDDVLEYSNQSSFPATGESGKIYVALDTNKTYRWSGSAYVEISQSLALGETSSTAFAGDRGKAIEDKIPSNASSSNKLVTTSDLNGKVDKVANAQENNFASFDSNGGIKDSGCNESTFIKGVKQNGTLITPVSGVVDVTVQDGEDGLSAFEIAQQQGYTGTVDQWLASLKANIGEFLFVPTDAAAVTAMATIGQTYASAIDQQGKNVAPSQNTLSVILLMNDDATTPSKTMMIATQDDGNSGFEFVYAGDLQSAMPNNVLTEDDIDNDFAGGSSKVAGADEAKLLDKTINGEKYDFTDTYNTPVGLNISCNINAIDNIGKDVYVRCFDATNQITSVKLMYYYNGGYVVLGVVSVDNAYHKLLIPNSINDTIIVQHDAGSGASSGTFSVEFRYSFSLEQQIDTLGEKVISLQSNLSSKLDKQMGVNLINPNNVTLNALYSNKGTIVTGYNNYAASGLIPINGQDIISDAWENLSWGTCCVFDADGVFLRVLHTKQYTYQEGDYYVAFSFNGISSIESTKLRANYGTTLQAYQQYTEYKPIQDMQKEVDKIPAIDLEINGVTSSKSSTVAPNTNINFTLTDEHFTEGTSFYLVITSSDAQLNGKTIRIFVYIGATNQLIGTVIVNGDRVQLAIPNGVTNSTIYIQNTDKDWTTNVTIRAKAIFEEGMADSINNLNKEVAKIPAIRKTLIGTYSEYNIIDVGEGYSFTDIQLAINSVTNAAVDNRYLILIHNNHYATQISDLWSFANLNQHPADSTVQSAFIKTKDYVDLLGADDRKIISVKLPYAPSGDSQYVNCHCVFESGDIRIGNLVFESQYTRYTMHEENGSNSLSGGNANKKKYFKNVVFKYLNGLTYAHALGIGTAPGEECVYENCIIESYNNGVIKNGIGNLHSHPAYKYPFTYKFINCIITTENGKVSTLYSDMRSGIKPTFVFENCDFGAINDYRQPTALGNTSLLNISRDWRKGGFYLEGGGNIGYLKDISVPCVTLVTNNNGDNVDAIDDTSINENSAYQLLLGEPSFKFDGVTDAKGMYVGSEYILIDDSNQAWSLQQRLGDCTVTNKTLIISINNTQHTITLDANYSAMSNAEIKANLNGKLNQIGCSISAITGGYTYKMHWGDNVKYVKNSGTTTIVTGKIVTLNGFNSVGLANEGDTAYAVAAERINPNQYGKVIIKSKQYFTNIGGITEASTFGVKYKCGVNGTLVVAGETEIPQFISIGNGLIAWV